ncbi:MAG: hypothetical protein WAM26_02035 [Nitrososphaeraceae archaeon]
MSLDQVVKGQTGLIPVIDIGAVTGFIVSKAVAPLLPKPRPHPGSNKQRYRVTTWHEPLKQ